MEQAEQALFTNDAKLELDKVAVADCPELNTILLELV